MAIQHDSLGGKGGHDCEFVEPPPDVLQTECSVCLLTLREPTIVSCCGYSFCRTCIEEIQASGDSCPLCTASEFTTLLEKKLQRLLNERKVWCTNKDGGCEWVGELSKLDEHLNVAPSPEERFEGCIYAGIKCSFCDGVFQRQTINEHENDKCPQRPYSCDYCRDYAASFDDVVNKHYPVCKCYPLSCPNKCDELPDGLKCMIERQNLEHHLKEECPLEVVECDFHYAGCGVKLSHKDMASHLAESLVDHLSLLAIHGKKATADAQKALEERDKEMAQLREDTRQMLERRDTQMVQMQEKIKLREDTSWQMLERRDAQMVQMQEKIDELERENRSLKDSVRLHSHLSTPPVMFTMANFSQHAIGNKGTWYSPSFYTHPHGYKLCVMVICEGKGCRVNAVLMRGKFDDCLHWPFQNDVYIKVLNQVTNENHITITGAFSTGPATDNVGMRVTDGERQLNGRGDTIFYTLLKTDYLRGDCLQLQVARVEDTVQVDRQILATINHDNSMLLCQFILRDFEQHKTSGKRWYSPSFYTHSKGYRMCLSVDANGFDQFRGTYISVYTNLMYGEFDSLLNWPFRGSLVVQLLNQLKDKHHEQCIHHYDHAAPASVADRVTVGERARGWGSYSFISHAKLGFNLAKNCRYLVDNCLIFCVRFID